MSERRLAPTMVNLVLVRRGIVLTIRRDSCWARVGIERLAYSYCGVDRQTPSHEAG